MTPATAAPGALERARSLIRDASGARVRDGYLDLLGGEQPTGPGVAQRLMNSRFLPTIYERLWRPVGLRLFTGPAGLTMEEEYRLTRELLRLRPGDTVLDVACGPGNFARRLAPSVGEQGLVVGIDASPTMLAQGVREAGAANVAFIRGDAERLPFRDASFAAVCCHAALYLIGDPFAALDEMARVLAAGGRLAALTSCNRGPGPLGAAVALGAAASGVRVFGRDEITGALERLGFEDIDQRISGWAQFVSARAPVEKGA
jgi:ubiquinone/menaquinone biosynthesis C-methylase UbiE